MFLYCMYLFKFYDILIILLLANNLTNIYSKISIIRFVLWMASTCKVKGLEEVGKMGKKESEVNVSCIVDQDHQIWAIAVDHSSKFKDICYWILWIYLATDQNRVKDTH